MTDTTLLVDVGNSRVKWAVSGSTGRASGTPFASAPALSAAGCAAHWGGLAPPAQVIVACAGGARLRDPIADFCRTRFGVEARFVHAARCAAGVSNGYATPESLGVDRWLAAVAAWNRYRGAVIVIDAGTAVTVDAVNSTGEFMGGVIAPGLALMREALAQGTKVHASDVGGARQPFARNTSEAIATGCDFALAGLAEHCSHAMRERLGQDARIVLTGGDAGRLVPLLHAVIDVVPELVLDGLALIALGHGTES